MEELKNALLALNEKFMNQNNNKSLMSLLENKPFFIESMRNTQANFSNAN